MQRLRGDDAGGSLIEYVAVILLAALVLSALVVALAPGPITDSIRRSVCLALDLGGCDPEPAPSADADYRPERCLQSRITEMGGMSVEVLITLGEEFSFITETFSDGRTQLTLVDTARLEATLGAGASINVTKAFNLGAEVGVTGNLSFPNGSTWVFDSPEEAAQLAEDLRTKQKIDLTKRVSPIAGWITDWVAGPDIPDPHITRSGIESGVRATAEAGLSIGNDRERSGTDGGGTGSTGDDGIEGWSISPKLKVDGAVGVTAALNESTDHRDGSVTTTYELNGSASVGANWVVGRWKPVGGRTGLMSVTRDAEGRITGLTLSQVATEGSGSTVTTTELPVETAQERAMVESWIGLIVDDQVIPLTWDSMAPTELGTDPSPFERWVFENGRTSRTEYANENNIQEVAASVKVGVGLGLGGTWGDTSMTVTDAEYLGAPNGDERQYVDYTECA
ncbi:hypothetical protein [Nocardiopsis ansamitocini]|uniref:Uncharacterized protein n=1 Tax=Nocardiopsis ansamitocini TaxID=1670832 RepID=A0A9W6UJ69_9ACTN|nr:hypothetical protein [Nocardiopsis ansamitocini]GLU47750.1 hypothetical protein Nans01_21010 [Nocardiopsis ansamitocini]